MEASHPDQTIPGEFAHVPARGLETTPPKGCVSLVRHYFRRRRPRFSYQWWA